LHSNAIFQALNQTNDYYVRYKEGARHVTLSTSQQCQRRSPAGRIEKLELLHLHEAASLPILLTANARDESTTPNLDLFTITC
jgi:hypothetical protein